MSAETVFLFSGQGSQHLQMGRSLYDGNPTFRDWMHQLDEIPRRETGISVVESLYSDLRAKGEPFERLALTHPAIFMVEYSLAQALSHAGVLPDVVLGVSMGCFAAAVVAGFLTVEDALTAVLRQAIAIEERCEPGGMIAILADPALFAEGFLGARSELAAVNFASHFVIAARQKDLVDIEGALKARNVNHQRLPVLFPFHSQWIDPAKAPFEAFIQSIGIKGGNLPLVCCERTTSLSQLPEGYFWDVVRRPIRFHETTTRLEQQQRGRQYVDVGPGGTLATFLKCARPATSTSTAHGILTPYGVDQRNLGTVSAFIRSQRRHVEPNR